MTPGRLSEKVVTERSEWVREMLERIRALPLASLDEFSADQRNVDAAESCLRRAKRAIAASGRTTVFSTVMNDQQPNPSVQRSPRRRRLHPTRGGQHAPYPIFALVALAMACPDAGRPNGMVSNADVDVPEFSADSAFELLKRQVEFGPRAPGQPGHAQQLEWMTELLRERADTVILQSFTHDAGGVDIELTNVFAQFRPELPDRVLLLAHWDTRPTADAESDPDLREQPILGANDGASGVAVLLELSRLLAAEPPPIGVDLLFTDGEDYGPFSSNMYLGAKHFAANLPPGYAPFYGILLDMVGDRDPVFPIERNSQSYAPEVTDRVWALAEELGHGALFPRRNGSSITDDHIPLNRAGIRTIDIIDFDYGPGNMYWHTLNDTVENTSPQGLGGVGEVVTALVYRGG